jgi:hypothetical protein
MILWGAPAGAATLGTSGLRSLVLPKACRLPVIAADNDAPVIKNGRVLPRGIDAAKIIRRLWLAENPTLKDVQIRLAPEPKPNEHSRDWNNVLRELRHG